MSRGITPASHALASGTLGELRLAQGRLEDAARVLEGLEGRAEVVVAVGTLHLARNEPSLAAAVLRRRVDAVGSGLVRLFRRSVATHTVFLSGPFGVPDLSSVVNIFINNTVAILYFCCF